MQALPLGREMEREMRWRLTWAGLRSGVAGAVHDGRRLGGVQRHAGAAAMGAERVKVRSMGRALDLLVGCFVPDQKGIWLLYVSVASNYSRRQLIYYVHCLLAPTRAWLDL
jgi:hypothetical protein